ncbi:hypothetical protein CBS147333_9341 [Penicillium roqueforti]|nr:hypothetical protein CBS147354_9556 [Penicillium roqueforti]KAI2737775.1 hypothetical protein DTO013F2_9732 [Penicillium roqueforti]KAI3097354.1 hypothetical protein CBS147333_9341 [Penicillium roqueforti]KAI3122128.1 hypothetical protein CBS147326_8955 [Penicillium roqueforti]KAI3192807.1 hypothetical protein CBS147311_9032 [Penicillium roqueforti]
MNPSKRPLPPLAESIRIKIKSMIPDLSGEPAENHAELLKMEANGNKTYGGTLLAEQISLMSGQLPISDPENWGWRLLYFAVPTTVGTAGKKGFLIPLSENVMREGALEECFYVEITDPEVRMHTAAIFFVPK